MVVTEEKQIEVFQNCKKGCSVNWWANTCPCRMFEPKTHKTIKDIFGLAELKFPRREAG